MKPNAITSVYVERFNMLDSTIAKLISITENERYNKLKEKEMTN